MGDAYGRRVYNRPPRQEWVNAPPQYYASGVIDPFGMTGGGYVAPGMVRPGNMGPPMIPGAFQHQAPFALPPPGPSPGSCGSICTRTSSPSPGCRPGHHPGAVRPSPVTPPGNKCDQLKLSAFITGILEPSLIN